MGKDIVGIMGAVLLIVFYIAILLYGFFHYQQVYSNTSQLNSPFSFNWKPPPWFLLVLIVFIIFAGIGLAICMGNGEGSIGLGLGIVLLVLSILIAIYEITHVL